MPKFFNFFRDKGAAVNLGAWDPEPLISTLHTRAAMLDDVDLFMLSFRQRRSQFGLGNNPTFIIGRIPSMFFPEDDNAYQISFMGPEPSEASAENVFVAWAAAGFQAFESKGEVSYAKGQLNLYEVPETLRAAFKVLTDLYGLKSDWLIQGHGDPVLRELLDKDLKRADRSGFEFQF